MIDKIPTADIGHEKSNELAIKWIESNKGWILLCEKGLMSGGINPKGLIPLLEMALEDLKKKPELKHS